MHLGRFHYVVNVVSEEYENLEIEEHMQRFKATLQDSVATPNENTSDSFRKEYTVLRDVLKECESEYFVPSHREILRDIGGEAYVGKVLSDSIQDIISRNNVTPGTAIKDIEKLFATVKTFHQSLLTINGEFGDLDIEYDAIETEQAEVGILVPREITHSNLDGVINELKDINEMIRVFAEVAGEKIESAKIRTVCTSDFQVFIETVTPIAAMLAIAIERIVALYRSTLEIKKLREELKENKVPRTVLQGIEKHEREKIDEGLAELARDILKQNYTQTDEGRKNELTTHLKRVLSFLADKIDRGVTIEVQVGEPEEPKEQESPEGGKAPSTQAIGEYKRSKQLSDTINRRGRSMMQLERAGTTIMYLCANTESDEEVRNEDVLDEKVREE